MSSEKLQKVLAQLGLGSRREIEGWITEGRVSVNGSLAHLGQRVDFDAEIEVDGKKVHTTQKPTEAEMLLYHKPVGEVCTRFDPEGRPTVFDHLPPAKNGKWINVGRLDLNTSGLLLFTNDGDLANELMHPKHGHIRVYLARVRSHLSPEEKQQLQSGILLEDGMAHFSTIEDWATHERNRHNAWYKVSVHQGRNRVVRRLFEALDHPVSRLIRIQYGPYLLPEDLSSGHYRLSRNFQNI